MALKEAVNRLVKVQEDHLQFLKEKDERFERSQTEFSEKITSYMNVVIDALIPSTRTLSDPQKEGDGG